MEAESKKNRRKKGKDSAFGAKGIPRKALKNLIEAELDKQAKQIFNELLASKNLNLKEEEEAIVEEGPMHNVECNGCGKAPIFGVRYKCSVRKDFDYCSVCEERLSHEYPFLKICEPEQSPVSMITVLPEAEDGEGNTDQVNTNQFVNQQP
mmetsp:Transcript_42909/g.30924  ORF Transcript_42909/g.30924 Transcript_42909/m.30924 type:complete len:151 (+) Transcript_42909:436-888(+)